MSHSETAWTLEARLFGFFLAGITAGRSQEPYFCLSSTSIITLTSPNKLAQNTKKHQMERVHQQMTGMQS